jgi:hypothetical protein
MENNSQSALNKIGNKLAEEGEDGGNATLSANKVIYWVIFRN